MSKLKKPHSTDKDYVSMMLKKVPNDLNNGIYQHQLKLKGIGVEKTRPELAVTFMQIGLMEANRVLNKKLLS
jgi:hypothetical protein